MAVKNTAQCYRVIYGSRVLCSGCCCPGVTNTHNVDPSFCFVVTRPANQQQGLSILQYSKFYTSTVPTGLPYIGYLYMGINNAQTKLFDTSLGIQWMVFD